MKKHMNGRTSQKSNFFFCTFLQVFICHFETELNFDPDPEIITDPDPKLQIISDTAGSGAATLTLSKRNLFLFGFFLCDFNVFSCYTRL